MKTRVRSAGLLIAGIALAICLSACHAVVTPDGTPYTYNNDVAGVMLVTASTTTGGNDREFLWDGSSPIEADSTVCAQFYNGTGTDQQGIALRISESNGNYEAITVTRNVYLGDWSYINFHTWNTDPTFVASNGGSPFTLFSTVDLSEYLGTTPEPIYPLDMCARTVGDLAQFIVWKASDPQPAWGSTTQGGQATIPSAAPAAGQGGWFAGHLAPGTSMFYTNLSVDGIQPPSGAIS